MKNPLLLRHSFIFNDQQNSGEQLVLATTFHDNGDGSYFLNQKLTLHSYCNRASFDLVTIMTPKQLRQLADEIEAKMSEAQEILEIHKGL